MPREPFQYAVVRVVPRLDRGEFVNAGVLLFCRTRSFLEARIALDENRLAALGSELPLETVRAHLHSVARIAAGDPAAGPIAQLPQSERFHWLVAPSSTVIQAGPVHTGLSDDPAAMLAHLIRTLVLPRPTGAGPPGT